MAAPIKTHMFQLAPAGTEGLVAQFSFEETAAEGMLSTSSSWDGPSSCGGPHHVPVCPGCDAACTFTKCSLFDTDCVESGATDAEAQAEYAQSGTCQCLNVNDCPKNVEACLCPRDKGLHRVCTRCLVGVCKIYEPEPTPPAPPGFGDYGGGYYGGYGADYGADYEDGGGQLRDLVNLVTRA